MFHVMVRNSAGHMISATRWQGLLLSSIVRCMPVEKLTPQEFWTEYCRRYKLAYGKPFPPDVNDPTY